jgi:hypothetical protein
MSAYRGMQTPWGPAQHARQLIPGVVIVVTAGHGGALLSPERNALVPAPLRDPEGCYEEDLDIAIPIICFPDAWRAYLGTGAEASALLEKHVTQAHQALKDSMPDAYSRAFGVPRTEVTP